MIDDSLPDAINMIDGNPAIAVALERLVLPDHSLIAILKKRGFKVYPEKRVRIYSAAQMIGYQELCQLDTIGKRFEMIERTHRRMAMDIGVGIFEANACVRSARDDARHGKEFRSDVAVILPSGFDFESEMWGIR
jgi:hypothetical protein